MPYKHRKNEHQNDEMHVPAYHIGHESFDHHTHKVVSQIRRLLEVKFHLKALHPCKQVMAPQIHHPKLAHLC